MRPNNTQSEKALKTRLLAVALGLQRQGVLAPVAGVSTVLWQITGRPLALAKMAFWQNLLCDRYDSAERILMHHGAARPKAHRDWAERMREALRDRQPLTLERLRETLLPARAPALPIASEGALALTYVLAGSLPQMQSGYAHRAQGLAQALLGAGAAVTCVTRPGFPADLPGTVAAQDAATESVGPISYHRLAGVSQTGRSSLSYVEQAAGAMAAFLAARSPAVVMAASDHKTALPALIAARRLGLPFVYEVRGFWEITRASADPSQLASVKFANAVALESLTAQEADLVFTLNPPMMQELVRRGVAPDRIRLLPNACAPDTFIPRPRDAALAQELGIAASCPVIGFVGSFTIYEGLDDLICACGILHRKGLTFHLVLVGDETVRNPLQKPILSQLRALIAHERLEARVSLPGRVPAAQVPRWYSLIDIAPFARKPLPVSELVPPLKPMEAMAMEKAILTSDVGALSDFVQNGVTGLTFPKGDIDALALGLERLLTDSDLRADLGRHARAWVMAERSWDAVAQRGLSDLRGMLAQREAALSPTGPE